MKLNKPKLKLNKLSIQVKMSARSLCCTITLP